MKQSKITFTVTLDEQNRPETIQWHADESGLAGERPCKAMMISLWDENEQTTMRIDLWTKQMMVEEMQRFFYESISSMAETYLRATNDAAATDEIRNFAKSFQKKIINPHE